MLQEFRLCTVRIDPRRHKIVTLVPQHAHYLGRQHVVEQELLVSAEVVRVAADPAGDVPDLGRGRGQRAAQLERTARIWLPPRLALRKPHLHF